MRVQEDHDLTQLNTLGIKAKAKFFTEVHSLSDLEELFLVPQFKESKKMYLGGGSNVLFTQDFDGLVIKVSIPGIKILEENDKGVLLEVGAGENWHDLVTYAVEQNWGGIENLAYIPGNVGAAPIQNIAAYGENFSDVFESLDGFNVQTGQVERFNKKECQFGYRTSIFKKEFSGKYIITKVRLRLSKNPQIESSYYQMGITRDSIKEELEKTGKDSHTIKDVYQAVVNIRKRKLPDPKITPTVGSFFLNSIVTKKKYEELKKEVPELQCYPPDQLSYKDLNDEELNKEEYVKVATGRLLQNLGWLGKWVGNVGIHERHALVVVTNGRATGEEIVQFSQLVQKSYFDKYGLKLDVEVNFI